MTEFEYPHTELIPKLIPRTMWGKNVRAVISHQNWEAFRWAFEATSRPASFAVTTARNLGLPEPGRESTRQCYYCDKRQESLHLHELWDYDDINLIQKLINLVPVCEECHLSLHIGYANTINYGNKAKEHLAYLNQWSTSEANRKVEQIFNEWIKRSKYEYRLDLHYLTNWLPESQIHYDWLLRADRWVGNKIDAIAWAQEVLNSNALILDTETTGLRDKQNAEVIELAIINMSGDVLYNSRFRPKYKIPRKVIKIHGITNEDVKYCPTFRDEYTKIAELLNASVVIAYNAMFDKTLIERTCMQYKLECPDFKWRCAMHVYRTYQESGKWLKLPEAQHRAVDDCKAVLNLVRNMADL